MPTPFSALVAASAEVASTRSRLGKIDRLASFLKGLAPPEIPVGLAYLTGNLPQGRIGVGAAALREARDVPAATVSTLTLAEVDAALAAVAGATGKGSAAYRVAQLRQLFARAAGDEQDFLVRLLFGELRQGAVEGVLLDAVARGSGVPAARIRRAAMLAGDPGPVAVAAFAGGADALDAFALRVMQPVQPMLADSASDVAEAVNALGDPALEYKLDGARIQVHKAHDQVIVYSRNLRPVTAAVPEVVDAVRALPARSLILDGEVLAFRPDGRPHAFQDTMRRFGRKLDVDEARAALPLVPMFFDLLHVDGQDLLDHPQAERFSTLTSLAPSTLVVPHRLAPGAAEAEAFLAEALARGHEGVMAKLRSAPYAAGSRGSSWLKVKAVQTLDLVVLAAEWGSGRRKGWLSNLHLGARDPATNGFVRLGKTFKGMTDELLAWQTGALLAREVARDEYTVYVRPELVVEIAFNDLQVSPHYPGGLALRFARVKRYRPDKTAADADTIERVRQLHQARL